MDTKGITVSDKSDKFIFSVTDEKGEEIPDVDFNILVIHEKPSLLHKDYPLALLSNNTLLVNKGEFAYIDRDHLNIVDFKNSGVPFLYQLKSSPKHGKIKLKNMTLSVNSAFSQKDINSGFLTFHQNGKGDDDDWDFFVFAVINEKGEPIASNAMPVKVVIDNTAPVFVNINDCPLYREDTVNLNRDILYVKDQEQGPEGLAYEVLATPRYGNLCLLESKVLKQGSHFTQADIDNGNISYRHTGDSLEDDNFVFTVSDGEGGVTPRVVLCFHIFDKGTELPLIGASIGMDNAPEKLQEEESSEISEIIYVNQGTTTMIAPSDLCIFYDQSMQHMDFTITLMTPPAHGNLCKSRAPLKSSMSFRRGIPVKEGEVFTKQDLANGIITYEHSNDDTESDEFYMKIYDNRRKLTHTYTAKISIEKENKSPVLVACHDLLTLRGGYLQITESLLKVVDAEQGPSDLKYIVVSRPQQGSLTSMGVALSNGDTFTQEDINQGKIAYTHDGSSTLYDAFTFSITDGHGGNIDKIKLDISITDKSIALQHNHPLSVHANDKATFTKNNLEVVYTGDEKPLFTYTVKNSPKKGEIVANGKIVREGMTFTQNQIEKGEVVYRHVIGNR